MGSSCFPSSADDVSGRKVDLSPSPLSTSLEQQKVDDDVAVAAPSRPLMGAEWRCWRVAGSGGTRAQKWPRV